MFSELQKDIIRPIHISADMAHNTFMRDWLLGGEVDQSEITRYLTSVKHNNNTVTAFLVSEKTGNYYHSDGILKVVQETEPRDRWYFRVRALEQDYETNVDPDLANKDEATVFINYRVLDHNGDFIGAAGVGLTLENVQSKIDHYEKRFNSKVYFIDNEGLITLSSTAAASKGNSIMGSNGIGTLVDQILSGSVSKSAWITWRRMGRWFRSTRVLFRNSIGIWYWRRTTEWLSVLSAPSSSLISR